MYPFPVRAQLEVCSISSLQSSGPPVAMSGRKATGELPCSDMKKVEIGRLDLPLLDHRWSTTSKTMLLGHLCGGPPLATGGIRWWATGAGGPPLRCCLGSCCWWTICWLRSCIQAKRTYAASDIYLYDLALYIGCTEKKMLRKAGEAVKVSTWYMRGEHLVPAGWP